VGKPSKLKNPDAKPSRYEYTDGSRKLYDRDAAPAGTDDEIWNLVLLFEQLADHEGFPIPGRPIVYTELKNRMDNSYASLSHVRDTCGIAIIRLVEMMIHIYWTKDKNVSKYSINDFCHRNVFEYYLSFIEDAHGLEVLAKKEPVMDNDYSDYPKHVKTDREVIIDVIRGRVYTEEETERRLKDFRENN
jgi:hypothetical protein